MNNAIFLAFDHKYDLYARACLNSLEKNYPDHPRIFIYYAGSAPATLEFLRSVNNTELLATVDLGALAEDIELGEVGSASVYYKYFAWSDFFKPFDNVMYLDVDTLILKPLDIMLTTDRFLIVPNHEPHPSVRVFDIVQQKNPELLHLLSQDNLPAFEGMDDMCNAGVFVIPSAYRKPAHREQLINLTNRYNRYLKYADQSAISIFCRMNGISFSDRFDFNFQTTFFKSDITDYSLDNIHICHFSSARKPNTFEFATWGRVDLPIRKQLSALFFNYANTVPAKRCMT